MKGFCSLASGSKGNSLYFGSNKTKILIDAGISGRQTLQRLNMLDIDLSEIQAILITHDHSDHIQGLKMLALRHNIPVIANAETAKGICNALKGYPQFKIFSTGETFSFGEIEIHPFSVQHDTADPVAFTLKVDGIKMGVCADLGFASTLVRTHLQNCHYLYVESNHEPSMVHACNRPMVYKQRVLGRCGHLSNEACAELIEEIVHEGLLEVQLAHLSQECNSPQKALESAKSKLHDAIKLSVAPQEKPGSPILF